MSGLVRKGYSAFKMYIYLRFHVFFVIFYGVFGTFDVFKPVESVVVGLEPCFVMNKAENMPITIVIKVTAMIPP